MKYKRKWLALAVPALLLVAVTLCLTAGCTQAPPPDVPPLEDRTREAMARIEAKMGVNWRPEFLLELADFAIFTAADPLTTVNIFMGFASEAGVVSLRDSLHFAGEGLRIDMLNMDPYTPLTTSLYACNVENGHRCIFKQLKLVARP
jgi:hypothetical protein